MRRLYIIIYRY